MRQENGVCRIMDYNVDKSNWRAGSFAFYAFLLYTVLIWSCELLDLFCWLTGIPQVTFISRAAALAFTVNWGSEGETG